MSKRIVLSKLLILSLLISLMCIAAASTVNAESTATHVSYNCNVSEFEDGDEVRLVVNTGAMNICTFIGYVEYDGNLLEYQGYEGPIESGKAYLELASGGKAKYNEVTIEKSESGSIVGMYMVGTEEHSYLAASPLVTLIFKAKDSGTVSEKTFVGLETSDGSDGFTSQEIIDAQQNCSDVPGYESGTDRGIHAVLIIMAVLAVILTGIIIYLVIKKKRKNRA